MTPPTLRFLSILKSKDMGNIKCRGPVGGNTPAGPSWVMGKKLKSYHQFNRGNFNLVYHGIEQF